MGELTRAGNVISGATPPSRGVRRVDKVLPVGMISPGVYDRRDRVVPINVKIPRPRTKRPIKPTGGLALDAAGEDLAFSQSIFMKCFFPLRHRPSNRLRWKSQNGPDGRADFFIVRAGERLKPNGSPGEMEELEVPAGPKIRLIVIYLITYLFKKNLRAKELRRDGRVVTEESLRTIDLGKSVRETMRNIGIPYAGTSAKELERELWNLLAADITIVRYTETSAHRKKVPVTEDEFSFWETSSSGRKQWSSTVVVSKRFYDLLIGNSHMAPVCVPRLLQLQSNPMAMDVFLYLCLSLHRPLAYPVSVSIEYLHKLFGQSYVSRRSFWQQFKVSLFLAHTQYDTAQVAVTDHGITLKSSHPLVPRTTPDRKTASR